MKKLNKKGFTIVELVIVIAVIAILAAVLIPTYSSVVKKANDSKALQEARNAYTLAIADAYKDDGSVKTEAISVTVGTNTWSFTFTNGDIQNGTVTAPTDFGYTVTLSGGKISVEKSTT